VGGALFLFGQRIILLGCTPDERHAEREKTGGLNFPTAGQTFFPAITRPPRKFSHGLA